MKKTTYLILAILLIAGITNATPLLWRGPKTIGKGKFIAMLGLGYWKVNQKYDWPNKEWQSLDSDKQTTVINGHFMLGYAPIKKFELLAHIPLMSKTKDTLSSFGMQDIWLKARYNVIGGKAKPFLTGVITGRFPTSSKDARPRLDDQTLDFALGAMFMKKMKPVVLHLKGGYWLNGKKEDETDVGDAVEGIFKLDYIFGKKIKGFLNINGMYTFQKKDSTGAAIENSEKLRMNITPGLVLKPIPGLIVRPKLIIPLKMVNKGGAAFTWKAGLDFWFVPK